MFNNITPLHFFCHKILPLVYDDSLSYYEVLCKVQQKLNEVISNINGIPDDILKTLQDYLGSDEFKEYLESLVSSFITERDETPRSNDLDVHRIFSKIEKSSIRFPNEAHYNVPQSICYNPTQNTILVAWGIEGEASTTSSLSKIVEYSLPSLNVLRDSGPIQIYHANGMTFDSANNVIYVCGLDQMEVDGATGYGFRVVDYTDFSIKKKVLLSINPVGCGMFKNFIYFESGLGTIQVVDSSTYKMVREFSLKLPEHIGSVYQDIEVYNGLIYAVFWRPATIGVFDLSGNFVRMFNIPEWWDKIYRSHEPEGICHIGNGNFILTSYTNAESTHYTGEGIFGLLNFNKNVLNQPEKLITYYSTQAAIDLYVDGSAKNASNINPIGDSTSPFRTLQEALNTASSPYLNNAINIKFVNGGAEPYPVLAYGINKKIRLMGTYQLDNLNMTKCLYFSIPSSISFVSTQTANACVTSLYSEVLIADCSIAKNSCKYDIECEHSTVELSYPTAASPKCVVTESTLRLNRINDTSLITLNDSMCFVSQPIVVAKGEFKTTFTTSFDCKRLPYATMQVSCAGFLIPYELRTTVTTNQKIAIRYETGGNFYDVFFNVSFNTEGSCTIYGSYYKINGGATNAGLPDNCFIASLQLHN